jgi:hypothetical protein
MHQSGTAHVPRWLQLHFLLNFFWIDERVHLIRFLFVDNDPCLSVLLDGVPVLTLSHKLWTCHLLVRLDRSVSDIELGLFVIESSKGKG